MDKRWTCPRCGERWGQPGTRTVCAACRQRGQKAVGRPIGAKTQRPSGAAADALETTQGAAEARYIRMVLARMDAERNRCRWVSPHIASSSR